jgi:hypothetical protein
MMVCRFVFVFVVVVSVSAAAAAAAAPVFIILPRPSLRGPLLIRFGVLRERLGV